MDFEEGEHRGEMPLSSHRIGVHARSTVDVNLGHLAEVMLVRSLHWKLFCFFPLSIANSLERSHYAHLILKEWGVTLIPLRGEYLPKLFGILHRQFVSSLPS